MSIRKFREYVISQIKKEQRIIDRLGVSETDLEEYVYHCGRENALSELLEDMDLFED